MVSIVLVAHSSELAEGVRKLAAQMARGSVRIAAAGGVDDPGQPLGTDALRVLDAVQSVYNADGVLILVDLGSALLSAEAALDLLPAEQRSRVLISAAPFAEGAVVAAVQAAAGNTLEAVEAEARQALAPKAQHLEPGAGRAAEANVPPQAPAKGPEVVLTVRNRLGLHARPAALFVATAASFTADVRVRNLKRAGSPVSAKSVNLLATLGVRQGDRIAVSASGSDAGEALAALTDLVERDFGEEEIRGLAPSPRADVSAPRPEPERPDVLRGVAASPGFASGPAHLYVREPLSAEARSVDAPEAEVRRLDAALESARQEIRALQQSASERLGDWETSIFDVHRILLDDPTLADRARERMITDRTNAEAAWQAATEEALSAYQSLDDPILRARAADVEDVGRRVLRLLAGGRREALRPGIVVAADLSPSDVASLDPGQILGICTALGGPTAHSSILARALGIPAVVGTGPEALTIPDGDLIGLDGEAGLVYLRPDAEQLQALSSRHEEWTSTQVGATARQAEPAITLDGHRVEVAANAGSREEVEQAFDRGAEAIGVLRTEFLYLGRTSPPSEDEQCRVYRAILNLAGDRPVIVRTLDAGGDKDLPYLPHEVEANPFLGMRGIRLGLSHPDLLTTQIRALLRSSPDRALRIMLPMISTLQEVRSAKRWIEEARQAIAQRGEPVADVIPMGIMVEVPSVAMLADQFCREVDFVSIGTNDLTQYTLAAERTNRHLAHLNDACHPAVLRQVRTVVDAAHAAGIWAGVCGEIGGDADAVPILVGLGVDELSVAAPSVPRVKEIVRGWSLEQAQRLATVAVDLDSAKAVREWTRGWDKA
jgi:phosphocarrier protein FPr